MKKNFQFSIFNFQFSEGGYTLLELVLYMGLFSILLALFLQLFTTIMDVELESESTSSVVQDGRFILARVAYDISRANNVTVPGRPGSESANLQFVVNGSNYSYSLNGGNVNIINNSASDVLNSIDTTVSNLSFKRLGNQLGKNNFEIIFTVASKVLRRQGPEIKTFRTSVGLR